jgi:hypothetical protein
VAGFEFGSGLICGDAQKSKTPDWRPGDVLVMHARWCNHPSSKGRARKDAALSTPNAADLGLGSERRGPKLADAWIRPEYPTLTKFD